MVFAAAYVFKKHTPAVYQYPAAGVCFYVLKYEASLSLYLAFICCASEDCANQ